MNQQLFEKKVDKKIEGLTTKYSMFDYHKKEILKEIANIKSRISPMANEIAKLHKQKKELKMIVDAQDKKLSAIAKHLHTDINRVDRDLRRHKTDTVRHTFGSGVIE